MKKHITPINIAVFLWALILLTIQEIYPNYTRYFQYLSLIVIIPVTIIGLIKQKKEDKLNGTTQFRLSIFRMLVVAIVLGVFFFLTEPNSI